MKYQVLNLLGLLFILASCGSQIEDESGYLQFADSLPKRWSVSSLPVSIKISAQFDVDSSNSIRDMGDQWNQSSPLTSNFFDLTLSTAEKNYAHADQYLDNEMGIYNLTTWPTPLPSEALAVTQTFSRVKEENGQRFNEIFHVDILVNNEDHIISNEKSFGSYYLQTIMIHEMGHALGLKHYNSYFEYSVMTSSISTLHSFNELYDYDKNTIANLYTATGASIARSSLVSEDSEDLHVHSDSELVPGTDIIRTVHELRSGGCKH